MALTKRTYTSGQTVITGENLNEIQDEIIRQGEELGNKAPSGYGLGTLGKLVNSPDEAVVGGFYTAPAPSEIASSGNMRGVVFANSANWVTQIWSMGGSLIKREMESGVFKPYEWVNPPMKPGVEYRTTERCNGLPVYAKSISYTPSEANGSATEATVWSVPHGISNFGKLVRVNGTLNDAYPFPVYGADGSVLAVYKVDAIHLHVISLKYVTTTKETFDIYYTKST